MAHTQAQKLQALQQAFITADKDGDSLLSKTEFKEFVEIGYHKQCPPGMYDSLCSHFSRDPSVGIDWNTARAVWVQAQGPSRAKSPSPQPAPQQTQNKAAAANGTIAPPQVHHSTASNNIKQAFIQCDKDGDGLLNKFEFCEFVKVGFKKPTVPKGMYEQVCTHFKKDAATGIDWLSAYSLWKQSNSTTPAAATTQSQSTQAKAKKNKTPPPPKSRGKNVLSRPAALKRVSTAMNVKSTKSSSKQHIPPIGTLSPNKSTGQIFNSHSHRNSNNNNNELSTSSGSALTEKNLRALDKQSPHSKSVNDDDELSDSAGSYSISRRHRRVTSIARGGGSIDDGPDASQMVVQMMESKVKTLQNQLKLQRTKRQKTEELAQSLLTSNEEYKKQIGDLSTQSGKLRSDHKMMKDELRKAKQIVDDDRNTIRHLKEQRAGMKKERDEAYTLIDKIEKKYEMTLKKERQKHKHEMEKLSAGFLQSLGAEPGKDVSTVIKELKQRNIELQQNVDTLAETLARKQQSLLQALEAMDNIAMEDEKQQYQNHQNQNQIESVAHHTNSNSGTVVALNDGKTKMKEKLKQFNERRKMTFGHMQHNMMQMKRGSHEDSNSATASANSKEDTSGGGTSGLPKPPKRRNSQVGIKPHHRPTATFFKRAVGDNIQNQNKLDLSNAKNGKELQFVSQQLSNDVANKTQSIQNLEMANTALMQQMQKMQKQMEQMSSVNSDPKQQQHNKQGSTHSINDLP